MRQRTISSTESTTITNANEVDIELETVKELLPSANANLRRRPRSRRSPREEKSRVSILSNGEEESEEEFLEIL